jgi:hypothetical protein
MRNLQTFLNSAEVSTLVSQLNQAQATLIEWQNSYNEYMAKRREIDLRYSNELNAVANLYNGKWGSLKDQKMTVDSLVDELARKLKDRKI